MNNETIRRKRKKTICGDCDKVLEPWRQGFEFEDDLPIHMLYNRQCQSCFEKEVAKIEEKEKMKEE